jgi:transcriptional regulator with PAS, ATPase and Fis domain
LNLENVLEEQALRIFFDDTSESLVIIDGNGYIVMMNKPYADFLGIRQEDAIGKHVVNIIDNTRLHIVVNAGKSEYGQVQRIRGHKAITSRIPIFNDGQIIGAIGKVIFKDSSELDKLYKRVEEQNKELSNYKERLRKIQGNYFALDNIIGNNKKIIELKDIVKKVSHSDSTVLITGQSGTGKEVFATAIHETSNRKDNNFVKINCAAIPEHILESELFGYDEGAFTGSKKGSKIGKFELANHGTIFLDEIGDMSIDMQSKILRVLQDKVVERVGGNDPKKVDVRIIAATNQNLIEKIEKGKFREDLYYRLNVVHIELPLLRDRKDDISVLCDFFIKKFNDKFGIYIERISDEAMSRMIDYNWPGNIRELENVIERLLENLPDNVLKCLRPVC